MNWETCLLIGRLFSCSCIIKNADRTNINHFELENCSHECLISYVWVGIFFFCAMLLVSHVDEIFMQVCALLTLAPLFNECWFRNVSIELITHYSNNHCCLVFALARKNDTLINFCCSATYISHIRYTQTRMPVKSSHITRGHSFCHGTYYKPAPNCEQPLRDQQTYYNMSALQST